MTAEDTARNASKPRVGLACNAEVRARRLSESDLERLHEFAGFEFRQFDEPSSWDEPPPYDADVEAGLIEFARELDALIVCHGAPRVTAAVLDACPRVRLVGELEGDRFARRIDVEAASERGVRAIDTTQGSSYPVAEWALAMMLIGIRNAGALFRKLIAHEDVGGLRKWMSQSSFRPAELTGRRVGLIGCGHIGRRVLEYLAPFRVDVLVHDPYVPREIADIYDVTLTSLDTVLSTPDVVVCLAPLTPATKGMLGEREIGLIRPGAVFVNVSRGAIVDSDALIRRLRRGDIVAALDVFDPEPIPVDSPIRDLSNVFLTPHTASATVTSGQRFFTLMVDELERFFAGHETRYDLLPRTMANRRGEAPPAR